MTSPPAQRGDRKASSARETGWQILLVFAAYCAAASFKVAIPSEIYWGTLAALVGRQGVFAWSNVKVHQAQPPTPDAAAVKP